MSDPTIRAYFGRLPFFEGLSSSQLDTLASLSVATRYGSQQRLFKQDAAADSFYVIRDGKVGVEVPAVEGEPLRTQTVGVGGVLGWSWLIPPYRWLFDGRALVPSDVITVDGARLRQACEEDHSLGYELWKRFAVLMAERLDVARKLAIKHYEGEL